MKLKFFSLMLCMMVLSLLVSAAPDGLGVDIQLVEIIGFESFFEESPMGNPNQGETIPPRPTDFRATINGTYLSVSSEAQTTSTLIVRRAADNAIVSQQQFSTDAASFLPEGEYTLEINCLGLTLVGAFCANN